MPNVADSQIEEQIKEAMAAARSLCVNIASTDTDDVLRDGINTFLDELGDQQRRLVKAMDALQRAIDHRDFMRLHAPQAEAAHA